MASACIKNIALSPEKFLDRPANFSSFGWFSPGMSFGRDEEASRSSSVKQTPTEVIESDHEVSDKEFEFRLEDPGNMLPADELFSDGKLMPLQLSAFQPAESSSEKRLLDISKVHQSCEVVELDPYLFSPRAPSCATRWKELLGLKRMYQNNAKQDNQNTTSSAIITNKSLKHLLQRSSKLAPIDLSLRFPLLRDRDNETITISSRSSLSSLSSGHDHTSLPRPSLDLEKHTSLNKNSARNPRIRFVKHSEGKISKSPMQRQVDNNTGATLERGVSLDSPRINSSGKIVFQSLERSSSSPSSFNGGPRYKHRGVERSYSANVRVTPVLNVPVCSKSGNVFGIPIFSAPPHKRDSGANCGNSSRSHNQQQIVAARTKRTNLEK
ncbi:S-adenosyl-L-methionine-dependent methyltransferases superfamily protein [Heracleum sosnowskyi]|uniref:S-adenosyl-L-methionine-dependent methyltransferases superfamily protein n=1 Tax=Heracleum sosnowskyi TaxID=360622 RepID=A0AAD8N7V3_9APIA|nr:S-adenosyl-L-methionine-dependent methyltransferases superfamily protein [Heracleum sosnowskyi]